MMPKLSSKTPAPQGPVRGSFNDRTRHSTLEHVSAAALSLAVIAPLFAATTAVIALALPSTLIAAFGIRPARLPKDAWPIIVFGMAYAVRLAVPSKAEASTLASLADPLTAVVCVAFALAVAAHDRQLVCRYLGVFGIVFLISSVPFAIATDYRFAGLSGNPNRLVLAIVILLPFALALTSTRPLASLVLLTCGAIVTYYTGSAQGLILFPIVVLLSIRGVRTWLPLVLYTGVIGLLTGSLLSPAVTDLLESARQLLGDLSGRTEIYTQSWNAIRDSLFLGTGNRYLSTTSGPLSTHNSYLSLLLAGGIITALFALPLLWQTVRLVMKQLPMRSPAAIALAAVSIQGLVQNFDLVPTVWCVAALLWPARDQETN
ncbi:O-antigen ligase family protein [Janibacter limosus]|uniref:O-antigen ligase family protein n=1 Tax=Janibacter limosus TaxID=53458 RepID=UPI0009FE17FE